MKLVIEYKEIKDTTIEVKVRYTKGKTQLKKEFWLKLPNYKHEQFLSLMMDEAKEELIRIVNEDLRIGETNDRAKTKDQNETSKIT